jgi:hypothetical protein
MELRDNYGRKRQRELDQAEILDAEMAYRNEEVTFSELFMFCQSFDKGVTVDGVINALGKHYRGE